jgi:hypothetical protein
VEVLPAAAGAKTAPAIASGPLGMMRAVGEELCPLSATPRGDQLTIAPYRGETGMLEVGPGGRAITRLGVSGQVASKTISVPLGGPVPQNAEPLPRRYKLPVGDYSPTSLMVDHGRLRFAARTVSDAYLTAAGKTPKPPQNAIEIRKDKPFVMEFSGKPEVIFIGPREGQEFKAGSAILVRVMLTEPANGLMITGLWGSKDKEEGKPGEPAVASRPASLDPTITIRNAKGEQVAEGKMPFG